MNRILRCSLIVFAALLAGCPGFTAVGFECNETYPCPSGYVCSATGHCVAACPAGTEQCGEQCCGPDSGVPADGGVDGGVDAGVDAGTDGGLDAGVDGGVDAGEDVGVDAGEDAGLDAGCDAGTVPAQGCISGSSCLDVCGHANETLCACPSGETCNAPAGTCTCHPSSCMSLGATCVDNCGSRNTTLCGCPGTCEESTNACIPLCPQTEESCDPTCATAPSCQKNVGQCKSGSQTCAQGVWGSCEGETGPSAEQCNGLDDDCDGYTDNTAGVLRNNSLGQTCDVACLSWNSNHVDLCVPGAGNCQNGVSLCLAGSTEAAPDWSSCMSEIGPTAEVCNNLDDDCDTYTDNATGVSQSNTLGQEVDPLCAVWTGSGKNTCRANVGQCSDALQTCFSGTWTTTVPEVGPSTEVCNSLDDDCDGYTDNAFGTHTNNTLTQLCPPSTALGQCRSTIGLQTCVFGSWQGTCVEIGASAEVCNDLDDDCDGYTDNAPGVHANNTLTQGIDPLCAAWTGPGLNTCMANVGQCSNGTQTCTFGTWNTTSTETGPSTEICNNLDDDCDGYTDNAVGKGSFTLTQATCDLECASWNANAASHPAAPEVCLTGVGQCQDGVETCLAGAWSTSCTGEVGPSQDYCNGLDDDCDGTTDDGWGTTVAQSTPTCAAWQASQVTPSDPKALVGSMCPVISGCHLGYLGSTNGTCNVQQFGVDTATASVVCTGAAAGCQVTTGMSPVENGENGGGCKPGFYDFDSAQGTNAGGFCNGCEGYDMTSALIGSAALGNTGAGPDLFSANAWCPATGGFLIASNTVNGADWGGTFSTGQNSTGWENPPAGGYLMTNNGATSTVAIFGTILSGYGYGNASASPAGPDGTYTVGGATSALYNATGAQFGGHNYFALNVAASNWNTTSGSCGTAPNATITGPIQGAVESGNTVQITTSNTAGLAAGQSIMMWGTPGAQGTGYNSGPCNNVTNITTTSFTCTLPSAANLPSASSGQFAGILNNGGSSCASNGGMGNYGTGTTGQYYFGNLHIQLVSPSSAPPLCAGYGPPQYRMNVFSTACTPGTSWNPTSGITSASAFGSTGSPLGGISVFDLGDVPNGASAGFPPSMTAPTSFFNANRTRESTLPLSAFSSSGTISVYIDVFRVDGNPDCSAPIGDAQPYAAGVTYAVNDMVTSGGITYLCTKSVNAVSTATGPTSCGTTVGVSTCTDGVGNTWQYNGVENSESSASHDTSTSATGLTSEYKLIIQQSATVPMDGMMSAQGPTRRETERDAVAPATTVPTVSGTIAGLAPGSKAVLQLNGANDVTVSADGAFSFATGMYAGETYSVTMGAEPAVPSQTCRIANGAGVMGASGITNVVVTCTTNAFAIGGTIQGLAGSGAVLELNGAHAVAVSSNGSFVFGAGAEVPSGAPYAVTVASQPGGPAQTCRVTNGTGSVGNADVTNVAVACTTNAYAVGGSITGLSGSGAVLRLNGAHDLAVAAGSTAFEFGAGALVPSGELYAVSVATQPGTPTQRCDVAYPQGTMGSADVTNVAIACRTLTFPVGGTITGLVGDGAKLQLNGANDLPLTTGATVFDFGKLRLASGTAYHVTIATEPASPAQTCTVTNGDGTVGDGEIANVAISCVTSRFKVDGTIAGLSGRGGVLQLNGAHDLSVPAGTTSFSFGDEAAIPSGTLYAVTFATQPTGPDQNCLVFNGSGTALTSDVSGIVISCRKKGDVPLRAGPLMHPRVSTKRAAGTTVAQVTDAPANPTWSRDVKGIIDAKCVGCHSADGIAPFDLTSYAKVRAAGALILPSVQSRTMPPWMPSDDTPPVAGNRSLSAVQRQTLVTWIQQGMKEGDAEAIPAAPPAPDFRVDATLEAAQPYTPRSPAGADELHCFVLDPRLAADTAVTGIRIIPGNKRIVHHARLFAAEPADVPSIRARAAQGGGAGYDCPSEFHGTGHLRTVGIWVPGSSATTFPAGTGAVVKAGSVFVMQIHYSLLNIDDPEHPPADQSTAELQYSAIGDVTPAEYLATTQPDIHIPPGAVQTTSYTVDPSTLVSASGAPIYLYGMLPHMHLHGTDIRVSVTHPDSTSDLLMHVPQWQFDWQEIYYYRDYITLLPGDQVNVSCTFDNTAANQPYFNGIQETPQPLTSGEGTQNEMCVAVLYASAVPPMESHAEAGFTPWDWTGDGTQSSAPDASSPVAKVADTPRVIEEPSEVAECGAGQAAGDGRSAEQCSAVNQFSE